MIHYKTVQDGVLKRIALDTLLVVDGVVSLFKTDADGERLERPHVLKNGEPVRVVEATDDSVTVVAVADPGRKSTFAHWLGASKLRYASAAEKAQAAGTAPQQQQQQRRPEDI
jgi:hypothetical protein